MAQDAADLDEAGTFRSFVELKGRDEGGAEQTGGGKSNGAPMPDEAKMEAVRCGIVGANEEFDGPFGAKPLVYADWTASGRAYQPIEDFVASSVYRFYANTHTSTSISGLQSTCFRAEARQIIQQAVNANSRTDVVLFTGHGATGAINKLASVLGLHVPLPSDCAAEHRPVVFVGPFEHHSNLLPWRESSADVINVRENACGTGLDQDHLRELLTQFSARPLMIGAFSAASNVTGVREDVDAVSSLLHRHGALAVWDYAAAGPYSEIDMNPVLPGDHPDRAFAHKDAVFLSPHKFAGGVNTPGILVAKKRLFKNEVPAGGSAGGGTVYFVKDDSHRYLSNRVEREEGGTPDVVGAIRAGLAFQLKQSVGVAAIHAAEERWAARIRDTLGSHPKIALLGPDWNELDESNKARGQLPIASFLVRHGSAPDGLFLHYNFVAALLNDLYGIQTRGGCACAGPYVQRLLGMERAAVDGIEAELVADPKHCEYLRPGFTRLSLAYFASEEEVEYILRAVVDVAEAGWRLLPLYRFNTRTGEWKHKSRFTKFPGRLWLEDAPLLARTAPSEPRKPGPGQPIAPNYDRLLAGAKELMNGAAAAKELLGDQALLLSESASPLRWFVLPSEALEELRSGQGPKRDVGGAVAPAAVVETQAAERPAPQLTDGARAVLKPEAYWAWLRSTQVAVDGSRDDHEDAQAPGAHDRDEGGKRAAVVAAHGGEVRAKRTKMVAAANGVHAEPKHVLQAGPDPSSSAGSMCEDNSCFRPRTTSKFPLRTADVIRANANPAPAAPDGASAVPGPLRATAGAPENPQHETGGAALIGKREMDGAKLFAKPPKSILRGVGKAINEWDMIEEGDRLLLGLSGGKDSLCLLHVLLHLQKKAPVRFEIAACTVDPMTEAFDPSPLIPYMKALGVTYHFVQDPIFERAKGGSLQGTSICSFCARMKRGALYTCARTHGYNKLVLAQHLDDCAETLMMGLLHNGKARSMMAKYEEKKGDVTVIRPLVYVREKETKDFSYAAKLPVINENCPACFEAPQERKRVKKLLAKEEATSPNIFGNIRRALVPLMDPAVLDMLGRSTLEREAKAKPRGGRSAPSTSSRRSSKPGVAGAPAATPAEEGDPPREQPE